ncbi:MAG: tetratricopeptide repeat protein [Spirochaetales bacterium]
MKKRRIYLRVCFTFFSLILLLPGVVHSEEGSENLLYLHPEEVLQTARIAQEQGRSDRALRILQRGKEVFPQVAEIRMALGDLFSQRDLPSLALEEYKEAEALKPDSSLVWRRLALTYSKMEILDLAVPYYERLYARYPDSIEAAADLGWSYFKTHKLKKGKEVLEEALQRFGPDRRIAMTLGTLCSSLYLYLEAKQYYRLAVQEALKKRDARFASVAYYNLALLEKSFNNYPEALEATEHSLALEQRASGYLALGDLYEGRMDFSKAEAAYLRAQELDETPLSRLSLASLYRKFGYLDKALALGRELVSLTDYTWMYYFGTSKDRYCMDVHELLRDTYRGLANREIISTRDGKPTGFSWIYSKIRQGWYSLLSHYHTLAFRRYAYKVGLGYQKEGNLLHTYITYHKAFEGHPRRALHYLSLAESLELSVNPESFRFYLLERAKLLTDLSLLSQAVTLFANPWEKEYLEEALAHQALIIQRNLKGWSRNSSGSLQQEYRRILEHLQKINPQALTQRGLYFP